MTPRRLALFLVLALLLAAPISPSLAQGMTPAQERAMTEIFKSGMEARALFEAGRYAEAEKIYEKNVVLARQHFPKEPLTIASALHGLAAARAERGKLAEAEKLAREALSLREKNKAVPNAIASSRALLASILRDLERHAEALPLMKSAVEITLSDKDADRSGLIDNAATLAFLHAANGQIPDAIELVNQLLGLMTQLGPRDQYVAYSAAGRISSMAGQPESAEGFYRQALRVAGAGPTAKGEGKKPGPRDQAIALSNLASLILARGRAFEAAPLFEQAVTILRGNGGESLALANTLDGLGESFRAMEKLTDAWRVQREALNMRTALLPESHPMVGVSLSNLGLTLLRSGELGLAEQSFAAALSRQVAAKDHLRAARSAMNLAVVYQAQGKLDRAIATARDGRAWLDSALPEGHPLRLKGAFNEAWLLLAADRNDEALALARAGLKGFVASSVRAEGEATGNVAIASDERRQVVALVAAAWAETGK